MKKSDLRTVDVKQDAATLVKPGELIDVIEVTPLTLQDRRIYNELICHAWEQIDAPVEHCIEKRRLRGSHNVNDRVGESIERLMGAIVRIPVTVNGKPGTKRVALLGTNVEQRSGDGRFYYTFPAELRSIIRESRVFARLERQVIWACTSKYALSLYEIVQKRINLTLFNAETFTVDEMRGFLGVPKGKLLRFSDLNRKVLKPAMAEVNFLSPFVVTMEPIKVVRAVERIRLCWSKKSPQEILAAYRERQRPKVGRQVRMRGDVVSHEAIPALLGGPLPLSQVMAGLVGEKENARS